MHRVTPKLLRGWIQRGFLETTSRQMPPASCRGMGQAGARVPSGTLQGGRRRQPFLQPCGMPRMRHLPHSMRKHHRCKMGQSRAAQRSHLPLRIAQVRKATNFGRAFHRLALWLGISEQNIPAVEHVFTHYLILGDLGNVPKQVEYEFDVFFAAFHRGCPLIKTTASCMKQRTGARCASNPARGTRTG